MASTSTKALFAAIAILLGSCQSEVESADQLPELEPSSTPPSTQITKPKISIPHLSTIRRLKAALADSEMRIVSPVTVDFQVTENSNYASAASVLVSLDDPRVKLLGGNHLKGPAYPFDRFFMPQALNTNLPPISHRTFAGYRYALISGIEFALPAGQSEFEVQFLDRAAQLKKIELALDGRLVSDTGFDLGLRQDRSLRFFRFSLPSANQTRRISIVTPGLPLGSIRFPVGQTLTDLPMSAKATMVFDGDSITEGAISTMVTKAWPVRAASLLGIRDPLVVAVGNSGYLAHRPGDATIPERIANATSAIDGASPDAVVVAAGVNDCSSVAHAPFPTTAVGTAALAYFEALRAAAPDMVIFVVGPFTDYDHPTYSDANYACRDAIFAAARQVPLTFTIDTSDWVDFANRDQIFAGAVDAIHPVDDGHAIYAQRAADAIRNIVEGL